MLALNRDRRARWPQKLPGSKNAAYQGCATLPYEKTQYYFRIGPPNCNWGVHLPAAAKRNPRRGGLTRFARYLAFPPREPKLFPRGADGLGAGLPAGREDWISEFWW